MEVIRNKKILALIGIIALLLGTFLPYFTFSFLGYSQSISLWGYWEGKVVLVLTLVNALFIFNDWIEKYLPQLFDNSVGKLVKKANNPKFSLIPTVLVAGFAIYMFINIDVDSKYLKYGLGFYLLWIGILALIGHSIFYKKQNQTVNNSMNVQPQMQQPMNNSMNVQPQMQQPMNGSMNVQPQMQQPMNGSMNVQPQMQQPMNNSMDMQPQMQQPMNNSNVTNNNTKYCPNCGRQVDINSETCLICGNKF